MDNRLNSRPQRRYRLSTQIYVGIGGAVALTILASLVGWFSFDRVGDFQSRVNEGSVPELGAAFGVAQYAGVLVAAAPRLAAVDTTDEFARVSTDIDEAYLALEEQLAALEQRGADKELLGSIRADSDMLLSNIQAIDDGVSRSFELAERKDAIRTELVQLRTNLEAVLIPAIDDQLFYTSIGYRARNQEPSPMEEHFSPGELARYRYLAELKGDEHLATQLLTNAFTLSDAALVEPLREAFESAASRIQRNLTDLEGSALGNELGLLFTRLIDLALGEQDGFNLLAESIRLEQRQRDLLVDNGEIAIGLVAQVDSLVANADVSVQEATAASTQAILTGRILLLGISAVSVGGAVLIAWLFVGRVLLRRLELLSGWMRQMAAGDLEARVEIGGRDEVADMAAALEIFRLHALEVQRLNLVEKLAEQLQGKNEELESVLADLRVAQDQIVMREKLAALGELTAGVAHEIRNPLNFVKNFSEVSAELIEEMREVLDEGEGELSEKQRRIVVETAEDLKDNLDRIRTHGDRANRIVHDMLMMGRDTGEWQATDINHLVDEYARLAYHSARATDPNFNLDLRQELDPEVGELTIIPQDLGRVFLNMVSNACYATDEKRRAAGEAGKVGGSYAPALSLSTRRTEDHVEVRIWDNGNGIPPEIVEKVFNPFFTTKPAGQGTGLGLAMSADIVRAHGGTIQVNTEPGEFTEMVIELPLTQPASAVVEEAEEAVESAVGDEAE